jgi:hypothetical protein
MTSPREIKIRQMIWSEYRAQNYRPQALINIQKKLGPNSASKSKIDHWYRRFQSGKTSLFDKYKFSQVIQTLSNGEEMGTF